MHHMLDLNKATDQSAVANGVFAWSCARERGLIRISLRPKVKGIK